MAYENHKMNKGFVSLLFAGFLFGTFGIWIRFLSRELTTFQQIMLRNLISLLIMLPIAVIVGKKFSLGKHKMELFFFGLSFPLLAVFFVMAMLYTKIGIAIFTFFASALLFSLFIGSFFFKEQITLVKTIAILIVDFSLGLFAFPMGKNFLNLGFIYALIAGFLSTLNASFKKHLKNKIYRLHLLIIQMSGGLIGVSFLMLLKNESFTPNLSTENLFIVLLFGLIFLSAQYLHTVGMQNIDLNLGTIVSSSEMIFATIFAALVFQEYLSLKEIVGSGLILLGIIIPNLPKVKLT